MASQTEYEDAQGNFQAVGEVDGEAAVTALLAETLALLGSASESWRHELNALAQGAQMGGQGRRPLLLQVAGALCMNADQPAAAIHFQDELIALSSARPGREAALAYAYRRRAQMSQRLGDAMAARTDLDQATALLGKISDDPLRRREQAEIFAAEAEVLRDVAPEAAGTAATHAIDFFRDSGGETRIPLLYLRRALARVAGKRFDLAEADLTVAIQHFEQQRSGLSTRQNRASFFQFFQDRSQAFSEMARVQMALQTGAGRALDYAERGRARTLLEAANNTEAAQPLTASAVQGKLSDDVAALFFAALDDRLLIWSVRRHDVKLVERPIGAARLRSVISRVRWLLRESTGDDARLRVELGDLYHELIAPVLASVAGVRTLVMIPDGPLHALPFGALVNPATGRYLVQDFLVMTAPSLSTMVGSTHPVASWAPGKLRAIVLGNPYRAPSSNDSWLPSLPFSEEEAQKVASTYPASLLLTGAQATKQSLLNNISDYNIVHYAGHALVNDQAPALSSLLMAPDAAARDDGSLYVSEFSRVRMDKTQLVVLAACSTGTGPISNGEGVQSLARPFLEAGVSSVVATFWDIQDRSAAEFFVKFHRRVADGETPAAALSQVQRQFIESDDRTHRSPSQWAWAALIGTIRQPAAR